MVPMPKLAPFFKGLCRKYCESHDIVFAIAAEALIDGMDLDESWCRMNLDVTRPEELEFALKLVEGKHSRISDFSLND
jgi:hypothetical protein